MKFVFEFAHTGKLIKESPSLFLAQINTDFTKDLYQAILEVTNDKNVVISPFFLQSCIALTYTGSAGSTAAELSHALKLPEELKLKIIKPFQSVLQKYVNSPGLEIANKIYLGSSVKVKSAFSKIVTKNFFSEVEIVDFSNPGKAADIMNTWACKRTNNKILNVLDETSISPSTNMILVNAIFFNGIWEKAFNGEDTQEMDFWSSPNNCVKVPMMIQTGFFKFGFIKNLDAFILAMKYSNTDIWMLIILPQSKSGLNNIEQKLRNRDLHQISRELKTKLVDVYLPKFRIDSQVDLKLPLTALGMGSIFCNPDFSNMFDENHVKVDKVIHKVVIDVNEQGTHIIDGIKSEEERQSFKADRPFFFAIKSDSAILFTGRYVNPSP